MNKIGYLSTYPPTECGIGEYLYSLLRDMRDHNIFTGEVIVFSNKLSGLKGSRRDINAYIVPSFKWGVPEYDEVLKNVRKYGPFDIFHVQHEWNIFPRTQEFLDFLNELRNYARKLVITLHTVYHILYRGFEGIDKYHREISNIVDTIIVHSVLQEFELRAQGVSPFKIHRIPHGTTINPYISESKDVLAKKLGINVNNRFIIVSPGFLREDKGLDVLVKAIDYVVNGKDRDNVLLVLSGVAQGGLPSLRYVRKVHEYIVSAGLTGNILFMEKYVSRDNMLRLFALADVVAMAYKLKEGKYSISGILHQALGSFKPIIGTKVSKLIEYYQLLPELVVKPGDYRRFGDKIIYVMDNYGKVLEMMSVVREYVKRTSWINVAREHVRLYEKLLEG
ncbi:MAG: hypothetical protein B6U75_00920 [Desulfurococcales archaeon ex4484_217_1]|nr:MAG: hypothetical protein B6U75_00920 [Desulfurococcales archaeon ex4484_217_1]